MKNRYIIGIDLGTTNSAAGYVDLHETAPGSIRIRSFDILQLTGPGLTGERTSLPSFLYIPGEFDLQQGTLSLPWDRDRDYAVGLFARDQGSMVPHRLVSSAKSWLCHGGVDRDAPILPYGAGDEVKKVSPITASARYLQHIREAWDHVMPAPMEEQTVVLTVPASFDQVARELTLQAAEEAGLRNVVLLEEPLAAFYSWLSDHEDSWQESISPDDLLLVCDVGGGTSDFTLISCVSHEQGPRLERLAVGEHLLLGGDNMDLAIAGLAEKKLGQKDLGVSRWQALYHQCREAKERMFGDEAADSVTIRLAGRGRSLVGGTLTTELAREEVEQVLLGGFYPEIGMDDVGETDRKGTGLREMGLPFCSDPAVTRHLLRFIKRHADGRMPSIVLYNGGSLKPAMLRHRFTALLSDWAGREVRELESHSLDLAISWGAVYYGLVRQGLGLRVGGGIPRAYFAGISSAGDKPRAVCLLERGTEEGRRVELDRSFRVHTNRPVKFSLYSSTVRRNDRAGDVVDVDPDTMVRLPALQTVLKYGKKGQDRQLPVRLGVEVTAIGTLELYCRSTESPHRWRLQFQLREESKSQSAATPVEGVTLAASASSRPVSHGEHAMLTPSDREAVERASEVINACFGKGDAGPTVSLKELSSRLSDILGMEKNLWSLPVLRALADTLLEVREGRRRSAQHEARWFNLTGFCLRPGSGEATDTWRMKQVWPLYFQGLVHGKQIECRLQWWIFWRRVCAGLGAGHQKQIFSSMQRAILPEQQKKKRRRKRGTPAKPIKVPQEELRQMWLFAASLERLDVKDKIEMGRRLVADVARASVWNGLLWALSRIGARQPLYGPANKTVPPAEVWSWLNALKKKELSGKHLVQCIISLARLTGDRTRDLSASARQELDVWLEVLGASDEQRLPLRELVEVRGAEKSTAFGESLPEGLVLSEDE